MKTGFGVIGAGIWGQIHTDVYSNYPGAELTAVCDLNAERAESIAKKYGAKRWYTNYKEMINDPEIGAVAVATPDYAHKCPVIYAANAKKHIIVEKPMATSLQDAIEMKEAAEKNNVFLMVDFHNRWNPSFIAAKDAIASGRLGDPKYVYIRHSNTKYVPFKMLNWSSQSSVLWFLGSHSNDLARWIFESEVVRAYAVSRRGVLEKAGLDIPDFFASILEFQNGGVAMIENAWILPEGLPSVGDFRSEILCEKGAHYIEFSANNAAVTYTEELGRGKTCDLTAQNKIYGQFKGFCYDSIIHFVDCVNKGIKPMAGSNDGVENTRTLEALSKSIEIGAPVDVIR